MAGVLPMLNVARKRMLGPAVLLQSGLPLKDVMLFLGFDPSEPRDEQGRWTDGGGADGGGSDEAKPSAEHGINGLPAKVQIKFPTLQEAIKRDAFTFDAKPLGKGDDKFEVTVTAKLPADVKSVQRYSTPTYYDPKMAKLETLDAGTPYESQIPRPLPGLVTEIHPLESKDNMYRGMSDEEFQHFQKTGKIESRGTYNLPGQEGLTYWTTDTKTAEAYANGFAPWSMIPTFEKPAYVVAAKIPKEVRNVPGTGVNEVGVARPMTKDEVIAIWRGDVYSHRPGKVDLKREGYSGDTYVEGSRVSPSSSVVWRAEWNAFKVGLPRAFDPSEPRDEHGRWTDGGGSDGGEAPSPSGGEAKPDVGTGYKHPTKQQLDSWQATVVAEYNRLSEKNPDAFDTPEGKELIRMQGALQLADRDKWPKYNLHADTDNDGRLLAIAATHYDPETKVGRVAYVGGFNHDSKVKALQNAVMQRAADGAKRIDAVEPSSQLKVFEQAGFKLLVGGTAGGGYHKLVWGEPDKTAEEVAKEEKDRAAHVAMVTQVAKDVALDIGFPIGKVSVARADEDYDFVLNGKPMKAAGIAYTVNPDPNIQGRIKLFPQNISDKNDAAGTAAHEVMHIMFQDAIDRTRAEYKAVMEEPKDEQGRDHVMFPDGSLKPPFDKKYPIYQAMNEAWLKPSIDEWVNGDGVSEYSKEWWKNWKDAESTKQQGAWRQAQHETLAEMERAKYTTGKFPEHQGKTKAERNRNAKVWRNLFRTVERIYHTPSSVKA